VNNPGDSPPPMIAQALVNGFRVLQTFTAAEPELTLAQIADRADLDTGATFHITQTLVVLGYIERIAGTKQFRLTLKPLELGFCALAQNLDAFSRPKGLTDASLAARLISHSEDFN
jgi:IclR family pca regulon transcriptional regulator